MSAVDDDGDGDTDCDDSDCASSTNCQSSGSEDCFTPTDDDGDGLANCLDSDCNSSPGYDSFNNLGFCQFGAGLPVQAWTTMVMVTLTVRTPAQMTRYVNLPLVRIA